MRLSRLAIAASLGCAWCATQAAGQGVAQPASVRPAALSNSYYAQDDAATSPSDARLAPVEQAVPARPIPSAADYVGAYNGCTTRAACGCDAGNGCTAACNGCAPAKGGGCSWCDLGEKWTLFPTDHPSNITAGGWTQMGYHTQGRNLNAAGRPSGLGYFNDYPDRVQLHQQWAWIEKAVVTDGAGFDWGFRMDYVYGTDGQDTQAFGSGPNQWDNPWDHGFAYGHAIPQLYGEVGYNDLKVKLGHFFTIVGYEVVPAVGNFFYSHSYSMNFTEPFTHTGALAEYAYSEDITLYGGWTAGWDTGFTRNNGDIFLGGASLQLTEKLNVTYILTYGNFGFGPGGSDNDGYSHSIVASYNVTDKWLYVFQSDYINNDLFVDGVAGSGNDEVLSINQYLFYTVNDCLGLGGRLEYYNHEDWGAENWAMTLGANIRPHANFVIRPEVRWDWFNNGFVGPEGGALGVGPRDQATFGIDAILTY